MAGFIRTIFKAVEGHRTPKRFARHRDQGPRKASSSAPAFWRLVRRTTGFFLPTLIILAISLNPSHAQDETGLTWGVNAANLKPALTSPPALADMLADGANVISLGPFYRAGGPPLPATPTECRLAWNDEDLFVVFRCTEPHLDWPAIRHPGDWYALLRSPSEQDSTFPDSVACYFKAGTNQSDFYEFSATLDGQKFGARCQVRPAADAPKDEDAEDGATTFSGKVTKFDASITTNRGEWIAFFKIPWRTVGGKPRDTFGFFPERTRWRSGEVSSPVAMGVAERPPLDLFIETHFPGGPAADVPPSTLCRLPSGILRWQRPVMLVHPDRPTLEQIWQLEQSLSQPTDTNSFPKRVYLTERWMDLLTLEGFNFSAGSGSIVDRNMQPFTIRRSINNDLQHGRTARAMQSLDSWLQHLDTVSRQWFADGSPGDILDGEWTPVSILNGVEAADDMLVMHCLAAGRPVDLHLSLPATGGVRIYNTNEGWFKPEKLLPLDVAKNGNQWSITTTHGGVAITQSPFTIALNDPAGKTMMRIDPGDLAFRFGPDGKILAVDFKDSLHSNEVIHGFGERYDHFDERGNTLTLWGMDDWLGNTAGLMNETYKPVPILQSSAGYMIFDNSSYRLRADIGNAKPDQYRLTQQGPVFDYYIWTGTPEAALRSYTALTGRPVLPPRWAFEPWMGRTGRGWSAAPRHNQVAEEEDVVKRFAALDIPHSAIYSEGSGADSAELNQFMAAHGIKVLSWYFPAITRAKQASLMPELKPDELPVMNTGGLPAERDPDYVDFTNPNALELSRRWWKHRLDIGVAGSMVDFGDRVPESAVFYDGRHGDEMHNFYSYDYQRTYAEAFREKRGDDFILFGRAAAPGTQKWVAQFGGDHPSNLAGLQAVLTGALNLTDCGFSTWGSDLGGFLGWPEPAAYIRWTEFACFCPLMRCHGRTPREPWNYGPEAVTDYKYYAWVHENLLDYIYDAAIEAHNTGVPMMRSLATTYPDTPALAAVSDEYMFGPDLLVAPVITDDNSRVVRLPPGGWINLWDGTLVMEPPITTNAVPLGTIPVYIKPGAVMPVRLNHDLQFGASLTNGAVNALIITTPDERTGVSWSDPQGKRAVALHYQSLKLDITANDLGTDDCLLIYGGVAINVSVDGQALNEISVHPHPNSSGWSNDTAIQRVIIRLPPSESVTRHIQIELAGIK